MAMDAQHLEIGFFITPTKALPEYVIHMGLSLIANPPAVPALPIVPNQDSLPDGIPVWPASILLRKAWAFPEFSWPLGPEECESLRHFWHCNPGYQGNLRSIPF